MLTCTLLVLLSAPAPATAPPKPAPVVVPGSEPIPPRQLKIAGGITLGLAGAALGVAIWRGVVSARFSRPIGILEHATADRSPTAAEADALQRLRDGARNLRNQAIGIGLGAAVLTSVGVVLLVAGHRATRRPRVTAAPWWLPAGGGLSLHVPF